MYYVDVCVLCIFYSRRTEHEECLGNVKLSLWSDLLFYTFSIEEKNKV